MDNITERDLFIGAFGPAALMSILNDISRGDIDISDDDSDDDGAEMPILEPISSSLNGTMDTQNSEQDTSAIPSMSQHATNNRDSPTANNDSARHTTTRNTVQIEDEDEDSMPDLQSISDSSDSSGNDTDEVEMMQDLQPVDDDNDSSWTESDTNGDGQHMPPLEPIQPSSPTPRNNRRVRVDDDEDQDRDRRHPSQRVAGTTDSNNVNQHPIPPTVPFQIRIPALVRIISASRPGMPTPPFDPLRRTQNTTVPNPAPTQQQQANPNQRPPPRAVPIFTGGFTFTVGTGAPNEPPGPDTRNRTHVPFIPRPPDGPPQMGGFTADVIDLNMFADFIGRFGVGLGQALGLDREEQEDPERAKILVDGLEEVPVGLVRRLEKVGGAPGSHVDEEAIDSPGCAICWDKLLDVESDGFVKEKEENQQSITPGTEVTTQIPDSAELPRPDVSSSSSSSSATQASTSDTVVPPKYPKIVCLPCAHVFHASCLIPWFSRPNQTTCPTCRFNIDPENLTYVRRPLQTPANARPATQNPAAPDDPTTTTVPSVQETAAAAAAVPSNIPLQDIPPQAPRPDVPQDDTNPPAGDTPAPASPTPPQPDANARNGGMWTFGFDVIFEQSQLAGDPDSGEGAEQQVNNDAMDIDEQVDFNEENGEMRREAEALAEQFLGRMGFNVTGDGGFATPTPATTGATGPIPPTDTTGAQTNVPPTGFPRMPPGTRGVPIFPLPQEFNAQWANAFGPPQAGADPNRPFNPWHGFTPFFATGNLAQPQGTPSSNRQSAPREKKVWSLPTGPGLTLRQRVEQKEREAGLRCFDTSCGVGPSDEEPCLCFSDAAMRQLGIRPSKYDLVADGKTSMCSHTFHPACLVSAERVAMKDVEEHIAGGEVEVSCPICRAVGCVTTEEWREGVVALT